MPLEISAYCVSLKISIGSVVTQMDANRCGAILIVDESRHLLGIVTDGDIRRAILAKVDFNFPIERLLKIKVGSSHAQPISAPVGVDPQIYRTLLKKHSIFYLPLVDEQSRVAGFITAADLFVGEPLSLRAVVMAGGFGNRLRPLTEDTPKPMLPVGDKPILEHIISQLRQAGIRSVDVTTHYKGEMISNHFGDGKNYGVDIRYVKEDQPLGTAGSLALLEKSEEPLLVINGDIVTQVDFRRMLEFHKEHRADMTVAVRKYDLCVPYGVVETSGAVVSRVVEKPVIENFINAGIYLLNPDVHALISGGTAQDMPDLINKLIAGGKKVASFPVHEYWIDIGRLEEYERAQKEAVLNGK